MSKPHLPKEFLEGKGANVTVIGIDKNTVRGKKGATLTRTLPSTSSVRTESTNSTLWSSPVAGRRKSSHQRRRGRLHEAVR